eukprot:CAMPEP_0114303346 /NCGR_PEP_ID=MMETSP0059-20121206/15164_1 /TAXON_ID=36894 /ORGANISM="Pyramimonas parkeae, Strain CCMP726" /LENGTH=110 /DNA_ID=CAMNT_0001426291 /DNA_START=473 /DNA_END=806 /DNA_ORIENTATION=+
MRLVIEAMCSTVYLVGLYLATDSSTLKEMKAEVSSGSTRCNMTDSSIASVLSKSKTWAPRTESTPSSGQSISKGGDSLPCLACSWARAYVPRTPVPTGKMRAGSQEDPPG